MNRPDASIKALKDGLDAVLAIVLWPAGVWWAAFVNWKVYGWLAPSVGLPPLSLGVIGLIGVAVGLLRWQPQTTKADPEKRISALTLTFYAAVARGFGLAAGWAFHAWGGV